MDVVVVYQSFPDGLIVTESDNEIETREAQELVEQAEKAEEERIKAENKAENERIKSEEISAFETKMESTLKDYGYTADIYIDSSGLACCYIFSPISYYELESITKGMIKGIRNMESVNGHTVYM